MTVTISTGLAVYNGERYIAEAVDSLLRQTYGDFELIVSDNASTDATQAICREFVRRDNRVRYIRHKRNMGAAWNFNYVAKIAKGRYFKWMAHDDICHPQFFEAALDALDNRPQTVLCYSRCMEIDADGKEIREKNFALSEGSDDPEQRFRHLININHNCTAIFGLIRKSVLDGTPLIGKYVGSDRVLLARLALEGSFYMIPSVLLYHREHCERSTRSIPKLQQRIAWFDPSQSGRLTYPHWRLMLEYFKSVRYANTGPGTKCKCLKHILTWFWINRRNMFSDLSYAADHLLKVHNWKNAASPRTT